MKKFRIYMDNNRDKIVEGDSVLYDENYIIIAKHLFGPVFIINEKNFRRLEVIEDEKQEKIEEIEEPIFAALQKKYEAKTQKNFSLSDLETGMYIRTRAGDIYLVLKDCFCDTSGERKTAFVSPDGYNREEIYRDDLTCCTTNETADIMEVFIIDEQQYVNGITISSLLNPASFNNRKTIWERK